jgi:phage shock protein PspC (stress-responsive transcriptional regulator)
MSVSDELGKLGELHRQGILSDEEFANAKARVLGNGPARPAASSSPIQALRRDAYDRWLGGVCGGLGAATAVPSWVWRLIFVCGLLCGGTGLLLYVLLWIFVPPQVPSLPPPQDPAQAR